MNGSCLETKIPLSRLVYFEGVACNFCWLISFLLCGFLFHHLWVSGRKDHRNFIRDHIPREEHEISTLNAKKKTTMCKSRHSIRCCRHLTDVHQLGCKAAGIHDIPSFLFLRKLGQFDVTERSHLFTLLAKCVSLSPVETWEFVFVFVQNATVSFVVNLR